MGSGFYRKRLVSTPWTRVSPVPILYLGGGGLAGGCCGFTAATLLTPWKEAGGIGRVLAAAPGWGVRRGPTAALLPPPADLRLRPSPSQQAPSSRPPACCPSAPSLLTLLLLVRPQPRPLLALTRPPHPPTGCRLSGCPCTCGAPHRGSCLRAVSPLPPFPTPLPRCSWDTELFSSTPASPRPGPFLSLSDPSPGDPTV